MYVLIDNYDSFTYNLWHYLGELGAEVKVVRNDAMSAEDVMALSPKGIIISPGPCDPDRAGICLDLINKAAGKIPLFGVCLGEQAMGQAFGGQVIRAPEPMHGKVDQIMHDGEGIFAGIPTPFNATRYHSLVVERASLPNCLRVTAWTKDGLIMGIQHNEFPVWGVQFHPESIETEHGHTMLRNFLEFCDQAKAA